MSINIIEHNQFKIMEFKTPGLLVKNVQEVLDLVGNAYGQGVSSFIIYEEQLPPDFFDLRTRLAGEILQKISNYGLKLAIVGDFKKYASESLKAFMLESNRGNRVFFVGDQATAIQKLAK